jgi:hypothetical protein
MISTADARNAGANYFEYGSVCVIITNGADEGI